MPRTQLGFSLLEAIVAMAIMATSLLALYGWLSTSTITLNRTQAQALAIEDAQTALAVIEGVNPMSTPSGRREVGGLLVEWESRSIMPRRHGISAAGLPTQFDLELFELSVVASREGRESKAFTLRKAGWVVARPIVLEDI